MLDMLLKWYGRHFTDPQVVALLIILVGGFCILYFLSGILAPLLVAIVLAYLLEWPTSKLQVLGCSRLCAVSIIQALFVGVGLLAVFVVVPNVWQQGMNLTSDMPKMLNQFNNFSSTLTKRYPALVDAGIVDMIADNLRNRLAGVGDSVVKISLASLIGLLTLAIYLIVVPLMVFFLLKDKKQMLNNFQKILPRDRSLAGKVWKEMNQQITNYIRGKVLEMVIVAVATYLVFWILDMRYSLLLAVLVGFSVLIPYIGAVIVTIPVVLVAIFQWGIDAHFWTLLIAYLFIQALDSNLLVPVLFSEAVNLHPLMIILSVIIFSSLWGFWGGFFAIPLASLVKAVIQAWPNKLTPQVK
ncbi:AI-2E family transporter [Candidatus Williamhamiltonella defendens]|uniref:AI-2E family transporter n=1 Tax=Candidatus Williamhamiltonella defendens TaxID=138072 RepID=UPI00130EAD68|nr:AI-2E family transporter [Candidatus Hamiltonella defensa]